VGTLLTLSLIATDAGLSDRYRSMAAELKLLAAPATRKFGATNQIHAAAIAIRDQIIAF
jgi:hypothetical protein